MEFIEMQMSKFECFAYIYEFTESFRGEQETREENGRRTTTKSPISVLLHTQTRTTQFDGVDESSEY